MARRLRSEEGFTLVELLMGTLISLVVLFAAYTVLDISAPLAKRTQDRVDASQRGRLAMDVIGSELRSQVCLSVPGAGLTKDPIIPWNGTIGSKDNEIWFYSNTGDDNAVPQMRHIYLTGTTLKEDVWNGSQNLATGAVSFPSYPTPSASRTVLAPVALVTKPDLSTIPLFTYYGFDAALPASVNQVMSAPIDATEAPKVVQVNVSMAARPTGATAKSPRDSVFQERIFFRTADPTDPAKGPKCL
jgi:type IV pilus assembly protein PilW